MKPWQWIVIGAFILFAAGGGALIVASVAPGVKRFAEAIAHAEGFDVPGSLPNRQNNPGDLTLDLSGKAVGVGYTGIVIYATPEDGWEALYRQVSEMFAGTSHYYKPTMTILDVAREYAPSDSQNWANNVASYLGVPIDTTLNDVMAQG